MAKRLRAYDFALQESFVWRDLRQVREHALHWRSRGAKDFDLGGIKASLMTLTKGAFPAEPKPSKKTPKNQRQSLTLEILPSREASARSTPVLSLRQQNSRRYSATLDQQVGKDVSGEVADFYSHVCPAGVYERRGDTLVVNAPNCVDCKATDVLGPRWTPREGGSGPDYKIDVVWIKRSLYPVR